MPRMLNLIADRALNRPLLLTPAKAEVIAGVLGGRIGLADAGAIEASRFVGDPVERDANGRAAKYLPYRVADGVAIISIVGTLVNRGAWIGANSGLVSYEGIIHQINTAADAANVRAILLDMETPGGEVIGCAETAAALAAAGRKKPTAALVAGMACSAGYWIASAAHEIITTETGLSGSIGVVMLHADYSRAVDAAGITPTLIFAGAHKVDANPFEPLSDAVRADLQAEVDAAYAAFVRGVAKGRGARLTEAAAQATEARTFVGKAAVAAGLADSVGTLETALASLAKGQKQSRRVTMDTETTMQDAGATILAARAEGRAEGLAEGERIGEERGRQAGAAAERARLSAIMTAEGIAGNAAAMAAAMALATDAPEMPAETVAKHAAKPAATMAPGIEQRDAIGAAAFGAAPGRAADNDLSAKAIYAARQRNQ